MAYALVITAIVIWFFKQFKSALQFFTIPSVQVPECFIRCWISS